MASKLILEFIASGVIGETITVRSGETFTFVDVRNGFHKVTTDDIYLGAKRFKEAYEIDENYTNNSLVSVQYDTENSKGIVTIENISNTFFTGFVNNTSFINDSIEYTTETVIPTLDVTISEADTDKCGKIKVTVDTNQTTGTINIERYIGATPIVINAADTPASIELVRQATWTTSVAKLFHDTNYNGGKHIQKIFNPPAALGLNSVKVEGTPFGASATIETNNGVTQQFSLDGVNYQSSRQYTGLTEGNYTAYVKDDYGCVKTKAFTVTEEQAGGLTVDPFIRVPIHNSIRFAQRKGESFLNFLSTETPGVIGLNAYSQNYLQSDVVRTQFKSSYNDNKVFLIDCDGNETEIAIVQKSENINRTNIYEGNYTTYDGRVAIYFTTGDIYNTDGTPQSEGHILNGLLPVWYKEGMYLFIEDVGATQLERIVFDELAEVVYAVTQLDGLGDVASKKITSIHSEHPYEVYEFDVNFNLPEGLYQLRLEYGSEFFLSEIIKVNAELDEDYLTVQWYNEVNNDILYSTGIQQLRRLQWEKYFTLVPRSEQETYDTDTSVELVKSKSFAVYDLAFEPMPMEVARGLLYGFVNSSHIIINGVVFLCETEPKIEQRGALYAFEAQLTLTDQTMRGQQVLVDVVSASFLTVSQDANGNGYLLL